jgi:hypothetical protein
MDPKSEASRENRAEQVAEWLPLAMEGEIDLLPILKVAFLRRPLARVGCDAVAPARRRNHLFGILHLRIAEARERRAAKAVEDALLLAKRVAA